MTILAAVKTHDGVHIGSDRLSTRNGYLQLQVESKWIQLNSRWWVGIAGNARLRTLVAAGAARRNRWDVCNTTAFGISESIRQMCIEDKWKPRESEGDPSDYAYEMLITNGATIHVSVGTGVLTDLTIDGHAAAGCGEDAARAVFLALHGTDPHGDDPAFLVERMVSIPQQIHRDCGGGAWTGFVPRPDNVL